MLPPVPAGCLLVGWSSVLGLVGVQALMWAGLAGWKRRRMKRRCTVRTDARPPNQGHKLLQGQQPVRCNMAIEVSERRGEVRAGVCELHGDSGLHVTPEEPTRWPALPVIDP